MNTDRPTWLSPELSPVNNLQGLGRKLTQDLCATGVSVLVGEKPISLGSMTKELQGTIGQVAGALVSDLVVSTPGHEIGSEQTTQVDRVKRLAPEFTRSILDKSVIKVMGPECPQAVTTAAVALARKPDLAENVTLRVGLGGSECPDPTLRLASYALPSVKIWENMARVLEKAGTDKRPKLNFFWACNAAIEINGMNPEVVYETANRSAAYIQQYLERFHPEAAKAAVYEVDNPWFEHDPQTRALIDYLTELVSGSLDANPALSRVLTSLEKRGINHGAGVGHLKYAGLHPMFFRDPLPVTHNNYFPQESNREIFNITVGGPPEDEFNGVRRFLFGSATFDDFKAYAKQRGIEVNDTDRAKPFPITARLITHTGKTPVYYPHDGEPRLSMATPGVLANWQQTVDNIPFVYEGAEKSVMLTQAKGVSYDLATLVADCGGEQNLIDFVRSMR